MKSVFELLIVTIFLVELAIAEKYLPILVWHSAGESCCGKEVQEMTSFLKSQLENDVYVASVTLDSNSFFDNSKSLMMHPFDQIKKACDQIQNDPKLYNGYNAIGLSQGGLFLRGLAQSCPWPPMRNLISLGAPQQGVQAIPNCEKHFGSYCRQLTETINSAKRFSLSQQFIAPLSYWHDVDEDVYRRTSTFLAIINNERDYNANYVLNLNNLRRLVLVKYERDLAIVPNESAWFGYFDSNKQEFPMEDTEIYQNDKLGLEVMKDSGRLIRLLSPGDHLDIDEDWFSREIIPLLKEF